MNQISRFLLKKQYQLLLEKGGHYGYQIGSMRYNGNAGGTISFGTYLSANDGDYADFGGGNGASGGGGYFSKGYIGGD